MIVNSIQSYIGKSPPINSVNSSSKCIYYHCVNIPDTLKSVVQSSVCHVCQHLLDRPVMFFGVDKSCGTKLFSYRLNQENTG